jgi:hypothetical protein
MREIGESGLKRELTDPAVGEPRIPQQPLCTFQTPVEQMLRKGLAAGFEQPMQIAHRHSEALGNTARAEIEGTGGLRDDVEDRLQARRAHIAVFDRLSRIRLRTERARYQIGEMHAGELRLGDIVEREQRFEIADEQPQHAIGGRDMTLDRPIDVTHKMAQRIARHAQRPCLALVEAMEFAPTAIVEHDRIADGKLELLVLLHHAEPAAPIDHQI